MKVIFKKHDKTFVMEGETVENRDGDLYLDGTLVAWTNYSDPEDGGWFISGTFPGRPKYPTYWESMEIE